MPQFSSWFSSLRRALPCRRACRRRGFRPGFEALEARDVPTIFTVTNTLDSGAGSLRAAILSADTHANAPGDVDRIVFNIAGGGAHTIRPNSALPGLNEAVILDGFTQPGSKANTLAVGNDSVHLIEIRGDAAGLGADGLTITATGVTVRGLVINDFRHDASFQGGNGLVVLAGGANAVLAGNFLGTNAAGALAVANEGDGVRVTANPGNVRIGGPGVADRNVISGNGDDGIDVSGSGNVVQNNYVGTDASGSATLGNNDNGVAVAGSGNTLRGNVISGNGRNGVEVFGASHLITGNIIGLNAAGTAALGNDRDGVLLSGAATNTVVGGPSAADRNVISGNGRSGVSLSVSSVVGTRIEGNFIGTDVTGTLGRGNDGDGVFLDFAKNTTVINNVISGNDSDGISTLFAVNGLTIRGNQIGTNAAGTAVLGNGRNGVQVQDGALAIEIGGAGPGQGNLISGNGKNGVVIEGDDTAQVTLLGNKIGTDVTGTLAFGNGGDGVHVEAGSTGVAIGADAVAARNVIAGNGLSGVFIRETDGVLVVNNFIGVNAAGTAALANGENGVFVVDSRDGLILSNVISGNGLDGIELLGHSNRVVIVGNKIGTNAAGSAALGNGGNGIELARGPDGNQIGGSAAAERNLISGNGKNGILAGLDTFDNAILGNFIGLDVTGTLALGNGGHGVEFTGGSSVNQVGDTTAGAGNAIAFNGGAGVAVVSGGDGNAIFSNRIFGNGGLAIDLGDNVKADGPTANDAGDSDVGANDLQNAPVLDAVSAGLNGASTTVLHGTLNSTPGQTFRVEFFTSAAADPSGFGEAERFLGFVDVIANAAGVADFTFTLNEVLPNGSFVSATASADLGFSFNTSELSNALRVGGEPPAPPAPVPTPPPAPAARGVVAFLQQAKQKGKKAVLRVVVLFADTGEVKTVFRSPFQKPAFQKIKLSTLDANGDGAADTVRLTARRNGKSRVRLLPV